MTAELMSETLSDTHGNRPQTVGMGQQPGALPG